MNFILAWTIMGSEQKKNAEYPYIIGYLGEAPADLKVMAIQEKNNCLYILVRDEQCGFDGTITNVDMDIILGHLENILDELPEI